MLPAPLLVGALSLAVAPVLSTLLSRRPPVEAFAAGVARNTREFSRVAGLQVESWYSEAE